MNEEDSAINRNNGDFFYLNRCKQDKATQISQQRAYFLILKWKRQRYLGLSIQLEITIL